MKHIFFGKGVGGIIQESCFCFFFFAISDA